jgi:hypothetical protein
MTGAEGSLKTAYLGIKTLQNTTITLSGKTQTYNGSYVVSNNAVVTGSTSIPTYTYYVDSSCTTKTNVSNSGSNGEGSAPLYAGTYYVVAHVDADDNYSAATSSPATITINKATPSVRVTNKNATYNGNYIRINPAIVTGVKDGDISTGAITYTYYTAYTNATTNTKTSTSASGGAAEAAGGAPKNALTYYVVATIAEDRNYTSATSKSASNASLDYATLTIAKANRSIAMDISIAIDIGETKTISYTYDGENVNTTISGYDSTIATCSNSNSTNAGTITITGVKSGTTTITLNVPASTNYSASTNETTILVDYGLINDTQAPVGYIIVKDTREKDGKEYVSNRIVDLEIHAIDAESDISYMALTNENARTAADVNWVPFQANVNGYSLSEGDGDKTIFLMLKDSANNSTVTFVNN